MKMDIEKLAHEAGAMLEGYYRSIDDSGQMQITFYTSDQLKIFAESYAKELKAENEALKANIAEWEKLKDPNTLYINLLRGFPSTLSAEQLLHLKGNKYATPPSIQLEDFTLPPVNLPVIGRAK